MNKKILVISLAVLIIILAGGFLGYKYFTEPSARPSEKTESPAVQTNTEEGASKPPISVGGLQVEGEDTGGFSVCVDECGNGTCQASDPACKNSMNCICPETAQDCPQDCK